MHILPIKVSKFVSFFIQTIVFNLILLKFDVENQKNKPVYQQKKSFIFALCNLINY